LVSLVFLLPSPLPAPRVLLLRSLRPELRVILLRALLPELRVVLLRALLPELRVVLLRALLLELRVVLLRALLLELRVVLLRALFPGLRVLLLRALPVSLPLRLRPILLVGGAASGGPVLLRLFPGLLLRPACSLPACLSGGSRGRLHRGEQCLLHRIERADVGLLSEAVVVGGREDDRHHPLQAGVELELVVIPVLGPGPEQPRIRWTLRAPCRQHGSVDVADGRCPDRDEVRGVSLAPEAPEPRRRQPDHLLAGLLDHPRVVGIRHREDNHFLAQRRPAHAGVEVRKLAGQALSDFVFGVAQLIE